MKGELSNAPQREAGIMFVKKAGVILPVLQTKYQRERCSRTENVGGPPCRRAFEGRAPRCVCKTGRGPPSCARVPLHWIPRRPRWPSCSRCAGKAKKFTRSGTACTAYKRSINDVDESEIAVSSERGRCALALTSSSRTPEGRRRGRQGALANMLPMPAIADVDHGNVTDGSRPMKTREYVLRYCHELDDGEKNGW